LEATKRKLAESSLKRELALKNQRDKIQDKIEFNRIRAIDQKKAKDIEIEKQREKNRQKKIQLGQILQDTKN
jgi:hypothetical protein